MLQAQMSSISTPAAILPAGLKPDTALLAGELLMPDTAGMELTVYTRYEHGNMPVRVFTNPETADTNYEIGFPAGPKVVLSARKLISELYGHDVHMPFDRYFRLGKYRPRSKTGSADLLRLVDRSHPTNSAITVFAKSKPIQAQFQKTGMAIGAPEKTPEPVSKPAKRVLKTTKAEVSDFFSAMEAELAPRWTPEVEAELEKMMGIEMDRVDGILGIDLVNRSHEVRKLLFAGFAGKMISRGYSGEDVLQEIFRGLLVRNKGKCPWDKRKSSFGHYVHMAINCILTNYHRKESKRADRDHLPLTRKGAEGDELDDMGWLGSVQIHAGAEVGDKLALSALSLYLKQLPDETLEAEIGRTILPMVTAGCTRREIVAETGHKESHVSRALAWVRHQVALWATEMGMGRTVPLKYRLA
jgi:hypothetical protein